jgi:hypothetical protein
MANAEEFRNAPSAIQYVLAEQAVREASTDQEHSLTLALTDQNVALICFALVVLQRFVPETEPFADDLSTKLSEVGIFQGYFG